MTPNVPTDPAPPAAGSMTKARPSMDILFLLGILAFWFVLQIWVLPKAGVPT